MNLQAGGTRNKLPQAQHNFFIWLKLHAASIAIYERQLEVEKSMEHFRAEEAVKRKHQMDKSQYLAGHVTKLENLVEGIADHCAANNFILPDHLQHTRRASFLGEFTERGGKRERRPPPTPKDEALGKEHLKRKDASTKEVEQIVSDAKESLECRQLLAYESTDYSNDDE